MRRCHSTQGIDGTAYKKLNPSSHLSHKELSVHRIAQPMVSASLGQGRAGPVPGLDHPHSKQQQYQLFATVRMRTQPYFQHPTIGMYDHLSMK